MRDKQIAKNQLINELGKPRQRFAKREKSETRHKQAEKTLNKREELYLHTYSQDKIKDLKPGDHLCCLYRTEEEHMSLFTPFLRQGLEQHEKVVYIVGTHTAKDILDYLRDDGVKVETYLASGQLSILDAHETYMQAGIFDPDRMITLLKTETERALAEGYSALRVTGEMSWALRGLPGSERLIEYEAKLNKFFPGSKCLAICQYDCTQFNPKLILDVITTHPIVVFGTEAYDNFYYMSPKDFLGSDRDEAMLQNWIQNLADRKHMEDAMRESGESFRHIFEQSPLGICIQSLDGNIVAFNKAMEAITGYSFKELKKMNLADLSENKEDKEALLKVIKRNGRVVDYQVRLKRKDGTPFDALLSISRINLGGVDFLHTICQDITERKQVEQALRVSEENYRQLTDSISDVFFEMDKDLRYTYWNKASEKLTGISAKDAIGKSLSELFPDTLYTRKAERAYLDVLRTQQPQTFISEYRLEGKDFFFDISAYPSKRGLSVFVKNITDRKQAEEDLREKEEFNFALFQHNPIQTIVVDRGGRVLKVNMAKRKSGDRLPNIGDVMYKDYAAKHEIDMHAELMECIRSNKAKSFSELKYGDKFLNILIAPFPQGAIITSLDITERKRAEEALRIKDKAIASSINAIAIADLEGNLTYVNLSFLKMWGFDDKKEVLGRPAVSFWETEDKARKVERAALIRGSWVGELGAKRKDGSTFIAQLSANLVSDEKGKPICKMASFMDISERKRAEEEKDKLLKTIETTKEAMNITTSEAIMIYTNDAMDELFGYKKGELIGKHVSVLNAGPSRKAKKTPEHITYEIKKKGVWEGEIHNKRKDGTEFICLAKIGALTDENGKIINYVSSQHNITDRKRAEEEIKNSQSQLRNLTAHLQSVREEERTLIAREMHDVLGQALTAMKMDLSWLDNRLPKDQRSLLEKTKAMSKLADATLQTVKKISTELRPELLDDLGLPAAIEWQAEEFQTRTGIKCEITVDPEDIILDKDRSTAIFRIFQETLTNVARHAKATKVKVSLKEKAGKIELKVRDNGKGITEEQVSNPKSFGLIGIKERAYYLGGKVVIKGLQDKGTTLTIRIPLPKKGKTK